MRIHTLYSSSMHTTRVVVLLLCQIASSGCEGRGRCASWEWGQPKKNPGRSTLYAYCMHNTREYELVLPYAYMLYVRPYHRARIYVRRIHAACTLLCVRSALAVDSFFLIDTACGEGDFWAIKKRNKKNNHPPKNSAAPRTASCGTCLSSYLPCEFLFSNGENVMENHACLPD